MLALCTVHDDQFVLAVVIHEAGVVFSTQELFLWESVQPRLAHDVTQEVWNLQPTWPSKQLRKRLGQKY
jgi:hypothetical protein